MSGIGTDPEETGDALEAAREAVTGAEAVVWGERATNADAFEAAIAGLVRAVEDRTREQVAREASRLRVRSDGSRQVHEAVRTRFGLLLPACGLQFRRGPAVPDGAPVTCPFCDGDEQPMKEQR